MKEIITIQHPQSEQHLNGMIGSWGDWDLTELGARHAKRIGMKLREEIGEKRFRLFSSDLPRARHTAEIIAECLHLEPRYTPLLREMNLGEANGKTKDWAREHAACPLWPGMIDWAQSVDDRPFRGAETKREVWQRLHAFMEQEISGSDEHLILVSHDGVLSLFFAMWLGMDVDQLQHSHLSGRKGGVSHLLEDANGHRLMLRLNDMSFIHD